MKSGDQVKAFCKCGSEVDCIIKEYSNATLHAHGKCSKCGKQGAFQQRNTGQSLEDVHHRLLGLRSAILGMEKLVDKDEAIAMIERMAEQLSREVDQ